MNHSIENNRGNAYLKRRQKGSRKSRLLSIISKRVYDIEMICKTLKLHIRTVQGWRKQGMPVIDNGQRPYLVLGAKLKGFLQARMDKQKCNFGDGELYCLKCRVGRRAIPESVYVETTTRRIGKDGVLMIILGKCENCETAMARFSTDEGETARADKEAMQTKVMNTDNVVKYLGSSIDLFNDGVPVSALLVEANILNALCSIKCNDSRDINICLSNHCKSNCKTAMNS